jgi:hypothetical protein
LLSFGFREKEIVAVAALLADLEQAAVDAELPTIEHSTAVELRLEISDPEVLLELRKRQVGEERTQFALTALRIGVLSLRAVAGQLDATTVKEAGDKLVADIRELLTVRGADLTNALAKSLTQYFDPATGLLSQKLECLIRKDGDLARVLNQHLGDDSVLASTLAGYLGEESPVFKLLSPDEAHGIRAQVETTLNEALAEQRRHVLQEFSLDYEGSALSRLVREMQELQEQLKSDFAGQAEKIRSEFSLDRSDSALCRLVSKVDDAQRAIADQFSSDNDASVMNRFSKLLANTSAAIDKNLTLDDDQSALSRLKREIHSAIDSLIQRNDTFHSEVRETLARLDARRQEAARSTSHGATFEDQVASLLTVESQKLGDLFEATGNTTGIIKNCKVGDCVTELGPDTQAPESRIVWEAKEDGSYDLKRALAELETARKNRQAQIGVFVFSRKTAPEGLGCFNRYGNDIVIIWDASDPVNDIFVRAAFSVGRALAIRQKAVAAKTGETTHEIELAVRAVEKHIRQLEDIETWAGTIESNSKKILDRSKRMREALIDEVGQLDDSLALLKSEADVTA